MLNGIDRDRDDVSFETLELENADKTVMVEWEWIGEGWEGDYDEDDPEDDPLLRFTIYRWAQHEPHYGEWEQVDDASYCTQVPATTSRERLKELAQEILSEVESSVQAGHSIRGVCQYLSWISA